MKRVSWLKTGKSCRQTLAVWLMLCLALFVVCGCGQKTKVESIDLSRYAALGEVMAGKTADLCGGNGSIVLVVSESDNGKPTAYGQTIDAFRKALVDTVHIAAIESVKIPAASMPGVEPFPAGQFADLLQKYSTANYLVSFVGVPFLTADQIAQLPSPRPQVVVVVVHNAPDKAMFTGKVVCLAAVPKVVSDDATAGAHSSQELFGAQYDLVTP